MMDDMGIVEEWLSSVLGEQTKKHYTRGLHYLMEFLGVFTGEELLRFAKGQQHFETKIIQYYSWLQKTKGLSSNSARSNIIPAQSFFTYGGVPLKLKHRLPKLHGKIENWKPTLEDLQKIYSLGDISVKAWMSLSRDVPARMGDMLRITPENVESGEFQLLSKKEGVLGKCYISEQTRNLFRLLAAASISLPRSQRGIDKLMDKACKIAGMTKRLNQHLWRKIFISTCINQGVSEMIWKLLTFKTIPLEQSTYYLNGSELRTYWEKIINTLPLEAKSNGAHKKMEDEIAMITRIVAKVVRELRQEQAIPSIGVGLIVRKTDEQVLREYLEETQS